MTGILPIGNSDMLSNSRSLRPVQDAAPIIVASLPAIFGPLGAELVPALTTVFTATFAAVAIGASVTLIPSLLSSRWFIGLFRIYISATGIYQVEDNGVAIGLFQATLNTLQAPFGELSQPLIANATGTALTLHNTSGAICTYNVTLFGGYVA